MWHEAVETEAFRAAVGAAERLRAVDAAPVRHPRVGDRRDAARRRGGDRRLRATSRSPPACAAARWRWWCVTSRRPRARGRRWRRLIARAARGTRSSPPTARPSTSRWPSCWTGSRSPTAESCTGGPDGGAADRAARRVRVRGRRGGGLRERGEDRAARRGPGPDRAARRRLARGRRGDGRRRAGALRRRRGHRDHRHRRPGRRDRGEARRHGLLVRQARATAPRWPATCGCPATATRSATARPPSGCTCCGGCCAARTCPSERHVPVATALCACSSRSSCRSP